MSPSRIDWEKLRTANPPFMPFSSRRSVVYGAKGVVACSQPLAAEAGLEILRRGGNAADACVATSAALNLAEAPSCGIGGDAFCLFYDAKTKSVRAFNGSGRSPEKLTLEYALNRGLRGNIPYNDINCVTVPGCAAAWIDTIETFGNHTLTLEEILEPVIRMAEDGIPISEVSSYHWQRSERLLQTASRNGGDMLLNGKAPLPGQVMRFPNLAETFRTLAKEGKRGFYEGRIAEAIVNLVKEKGGVMELSDLANHKTEFVDPIKYTYAGEVDVYECPPNGQGLVALIALGILDSLEEQDIIKPLLSMEHNSPEYLHALIEALRLGFADGQFYITDPDTYNTPVDKLLSKDYLASRAKLIDPKKTNPEYVHGNPFNSSDTVYFTVTDQWGNACSYIQSNYAGFGTGAIPDGCGFSLQNRGSGFVLDKKHPNCLEGGKRPYNTIIPSIAISKDFVWSFGVMAGFMQPQGHVQILLNLLRGFTPQAALDAPRFCISPPPHLTSDIEALENQEVQEPNPSRSDSPNCEVYFEDGISPETIQKLREMGHDASILTGHARSQFGRGQIIQRVSQGGRLVWAAGSDPRTDGHAVAQI